MEVKNPMMDPMLVNLPAQPQTNAKASRGSDFDSMVQKRTESKKTETRADKTPQEKATAKPADDAKEPSDDSYAAAAAMIYKAMPDARVILQQPETAEIVPEQVQTVTDEAAIPAELLEIPEAQSATAAVPAMEVPIETGMVETKSENMAEPAVRDAQPVQNTEAPDTDRIVRPEAAEQADEGDDGMEQSEQNAQPAQDTALFANVNAPVIKVAEVSHPIPLEAENGIEQLGREIGLVVNSADANRVEVTLTPENLGKLTVEISRGTDGTLNVVVHTSNERAANLLEKGIDGLRQAMAAGAERGVQIQVRGSEESQQQFLNPDGQNEQNRGQQQQQNRRRDEQRNAQDFMQQLRLGLVDVESGD